ncbi:MAG: carbohydrate-binding domain-containing protein [Muribaculaceae bacterium]|nr:carbohydrate-binding domain-containing protein [Muribaculaceae bacterium]
MNKRFLIITASVVTAIAIIAATVQTLNVRMGQVIYQYATDQVGRMALSSNGTVATILNKVFNLDQVDEMYIDETPVTDNMVYVDYDGTTAQVRVAGNIAQYVDATVTGAHVAITQSETFPGDDLGEITYVLSGTSSNGSFWMDGAYKMTLELDGVNLTNPDSAAINIRDGKRIGVTLVDGTTNTLVDGANGSQKGCFAVKGHTEFTGGGSLTITGNTGHAFWGKEYVEFKKKLTGSITVTKAVGDGFNVNQYIKVNGGTITISGVGDDGMQLSQSTDDAGVVEEDADNTGIFTMNGGTLNITTTAAGAKGIKAAVDYVMTGGTVTVNQTGTYTYDGTDASYCAGIKTDANINITGGTVNITSTADGGRGLNCDGTINIDQTSATTNIDIKANGVGGVLEQNAEPGSSSGTTTGSYKVYVSLPTSGGGYGGSNPWTKVYLYKSDGTNLGQLTNTVTRSSGYSTLTFYYYDFGQATSDTYYFKADDYYSSRYGTCTIRSTEFAGPSSGSDVYYSISNSYTGTTARVYQITNVTSTYGGTSESTEDSGDTYNASGLKCDGNLTIGGGTVTIANSGMMSKSIKTKATATINGGTITLTPSGAMKAVTLNGVIDASYSTGVKAVDFVMNDGSLTINASGTAGKGISATGITTNGGTINITNTGGPQASSAGDYYTAKGMKADGNMALNAGGITIKMTGNGGKCIKVNGAYTQGTSSTSGPTLTVSTTGTAAGTSSSGGWGGPGGGSSVSGSAKGIKVMGNLTINGGTVKVSATGGEGSEGIESKSVMTINGGYVECNTYDDALNSASHMYIKGGYVYAVATNNDAIDSNGNMYLSGGMVFCCGSEEGLDANSEGGYKVYIQSGANIAAIGRSMGAIESGASISQTCYQTTASSSTWYALYNGTTVVAAFQTPTLSSSGGGYGPGGGGGNSSTMVVTSPSCKLYSGVTGSGTSFWSGKGYSNASGGSSVSLSTYSGGSGW